MRDHVEFERAYLARQADPNAPMPNCTWPDGTERERYMDLEQIAGMVEYLDSKRSACAGNPMYHYYRCKNLQPNGDCGIYDTRPDMCRDYPYGRPCKIEGCTWDAVQPKPGGEDASPAA
jgi:Fe-S-cluster containining protein